MAWLRFVHKPLRHARSKTRALAKVLDLRSFSKHGYSYATDPNESLTQSFRDALKFLPNINVLILDNIHDVDPCALVELTEEHSYPLLLSIHGCQAHLPIPFYASSSLRMLVYLDISNTPGTISPIISRGVFPDLRILKVRGKEMGDSSFAGLCQLYRLRLWSLDVSDNKLTDAAIPMLAGYCFPTNSLRSESNFKVDGALSNPGIGSSEYGLFYFIEESDWSYDYSHPLRYAMDVPKNINEYYSGSQHQITRSDMRDARKLDTLDAAMHLLCQQSSKYDTMEKYRIARGITHIALSRNQISASGLEQLVRMSNGQLEHIECDDLPFLGPSVATGKHWPKTARLYGCVGAAYVFRPVFSCNIRSLRIHHSLVTNIPTLTVDGLSNLACLFLAETQILARADRAYSEPFVPDMNPRIEFITLTCVPRRSSGPLIERLVKFLRLLSIQERDIKLARQTGASVRPFGILKGLRRLRLEFEPDTNEEGVSAAEELDPAELLRSGEPRFSFFQTESSTITSPPAKPKGIGKTFDTSNGLISEVLKNPQLSGRDNNEFVSYDCHWNEQVVQVWVWAGSAAADTNPGIKDYRRLVLEENVRGGVGPVTPAQILAGAPNRALIFHTAWRLAIMPRQFRDPSLAELTGMQDVLAALKAYRRAGRDRLALLRQNEAKPGSVPAGEEFWTGQLEVSTQEALPHARSEHYWR